MRNRQTAHKELFTTTEIANASALTRDGCNVSAHTAAGEDKASAARRPTTSTLDIGSPVSNHHWYAALTRGISQRQIRA
jgi:hypothetical protein